MKLYSQISQNIAIKYPISEDEIKDENVWEYKILVVGDHLVGKSSICLRFTMNEFNLEIKPSSQSECYAKTLKIFDQFIRIYLIDVDSGTIQNPKSYWYSDVKGAIIVYDITKIKSFENTENWLKEIKQNWGNTIPFVVAGNKNDLKFLRNVDFEEVNEKFNGVGNVEVKEISCIDLDSVADCVKMWIARIYYHELSDEKKDEYKKIFGGAPTKVGGQEPKNENNNGNVGKENKKENEDEKDKDKEKEKTQENEGEKEEEKEKTQENEGEKEEDK